MQQPLPNQHLSPQAASRPSDQGADPQHIRELHRNLRSQSSPPPVESDAASALASGPRCGVASGVRRVVLREASRNCLYRSTQRQIMDLPFKLVGRPILQRRGGRTAVLDRLDRSTKSAGGGPGGRAPLGDIMRRTRPGFTARPQFGGKLPVKRVTDPRNQPR